MKAQEMIQCLAPNGERGTFLQGENNGPLISPVFPDYVALHAWMKANDWEAEKQTLNTLFIKKREAFPLRAMPSSPMTQAEMEAQTKIISSCPEISEAEELQEWQVVTLSYRVKVSDAREWSEEHDDNQQADMSDEDICSHYLQCQVQSNSDFDGVAVEYVEA